MSKKDDFLKDIHAAMEKHDVYLDAVGRGGEDEGFRGYFKTGCEIVADFEDIDRNQPLFKKNRGVKRFVIEAGSKIDEITRWAEQLEASAIECLREIETIYGGAATKRDPSAPKGELVYKVTYEPPIHFSSDDSPELSAAKLRFINDVQNAAMRFAAECSKSQEG